MHNLWVSLPSVRGVHPMTVWNLFDIRTELEKAGHRLHGSSVYRMPLDLARNEMATVFLSTSCDMNLLLDDDVQLGAPWVVAMMKAIEAGADVVSAPCKLRDHSHGGAQDFSPFNVRPIGDAIERGGMRLLPCEWTGLGAVMVSRRVIEELHINRKQYPSRLMPGRTSSAIFTSRVEPARSLMESAPADLHVYILDDMVFSLAVRALGYTIYAAIDVPTVHDGMTGCFAEEAEKLQKMQERAAAQAQLVRGAGLLGADGKPVGPGR